MESKKSILNNKGWYILVTMIGIVFASWLGTPAAVHGDVFNDAYSYEDSFEDSSGIDLAETQGFVVTDGGLQAYEAPAVAVSGCISLPQPEGSTFQAWSLLEISIADLGAGSPTLEIQDCSGNTLKTVSDLSEGESTVDLSDISAAAIRLVWAVDQVGAKLDFWNVYGTAESPTRIEVVPSGDMVNAGETVSFSIGLSTSGALARNPVLHFSLDDINGLHTPALDDGLAEDAEVDYGSGEGVTSYRPLEFVAATNGPNGEVPAKPETGATAGEVVWDLEDLSDGFFDNVVVTLRIPNGYVNGKTLAARAVLEHGISSGAYTNHMSEEKTSGSVTVNSVPNSDQRAYSPFGNVGSGATGIRDDYWLQDSVPPEAGPSDMEDLTVTITGTGTCTPLFRDVKIDPRAPYSYQVVSTPEVGDPITVDDPVIVHFDRTHFCDRCARVMTDFDVPNGCGEGNTIGTQSEMVAGNPIWDDIDSKTHNVVPEVCRRGRNHVHRVMSGNDPGTYIHWPGWGEYYINRGSLRAGENFTTWAPYGNESHRTHSVTLDHSYDLIEIPAGITFHGIRLTRNLNRLYKDCTGIAPAPTDPAFDHNADPPHPAWKPVDITWDGAPFSNPPDVNDPTAVVLPGCRLLGVKDDDAPSWIGPDYGIWNPYFIWRVCDGSYGCAELPETTAMSLVGGTIYTHETVTDPAGVTHECHTYGGWTLYKELRSWPRVYSWVEENQVPAGQVAHIIVNPENDNHASQWVEGRWVVNLYGSRDYIDLQGVTGEVLTEGLMIPDADQNVVGQSCDTANDITFHVPDPSGCSSAVSEDDEACMAWWEVPAACQPPNGWGSPIPGNLTHDNYVPMYRFRLNAPVLNTTPATTVIDFVAEVRTTGLTARGADNAVDPARWSGANYSTSSSVSVLEMPGLDLSAAGPAARKVGDTFTYTLKLTNFGNTPNNGWYLVTWLPRTGVNSSEFTPEYGQAYVNELPDDVIVEYSTNADCFTDPLGVIWTAMALQATSRTGYQAETVSAIAPDAAGLRLRRRPDATEHFNPGNILLGALDVVIPNNVLLEGKWLYTRALAGAAMLFGAASDVAPVETVNVRTMVSPEAAVEIEKTLEIDATRAGWIKWSLWVHNVSGATATNIEVLDELPEEIIYEGLAESLPSGWSPIEEPTVGDIDGRLRVMISELDPDDGNPGTGDDEGGIAFRSRLNEGTPMGTVIENCATATPEQGSGDRSCASTTVPNLEVMKDQEAVDRVRATPTTDVFHGDVISYTITATNGFDHVVYITIHDELDDYVDYVPNTLTVNSATASNTFITDGVLDYPYPDPVVPGETLRLAFDVRVKAGAPNNQLIENTAQITACIDPRHPSSCFSAVETAPVYNLIRDLGAFAQAFGSVIGEANYSSEWDSDLDGDVDGIDLSILVNGP